MNMYQRGLTCYITHSSAQPVIHHLVIGRAEALPQQLQHRAVRQDLVLSELR